MGPKVLSSLLSSALLLAAGCGTDIAQTAVLGPTDPLSCVAPGGLGLPTRGAFGDGSEQASSLVGKGYAAGDGPGLRVVARDAFRVYLNGELVVESEAVREGVFVPLILLPGENVLSVVVSALHGTPAALVDFEELDIEVVSDASWKVSTDPEAGHLEPGFDDSSWSAATDFGDALSLARCDAEGSLPVGTLAHWIGPTEGAGPTAVLRKVIRLDPVGYGEETTGGAGASPALVDTWEELVAAAESDVPSIILLAQGEHDFRDPRDQAACPSICTNDTTRTYYDVISSDETCAEALVTRPRNERRLSVASNKTIVGLGRGALVRGVSFDLPGVENVIVRNVALYDVNPELGEAGDAFTLSAAKRVWIDHVTTKWISDGFSDLLPGTEDVTVSWVRYDGVTPGECRGWHTQAVNVDDALATFHHCFFDHVESHAPRVDGASARVHMAENYFADNGSYAVASICGSEVLVEANTFQRVRTPTLRSPCDDETSPGKIGTRSNSYGEDVGEHHGGDGMEPHDDVFDPPYDYWRDRDPDDWLRVFTRAGAGGRWPLSISLD